MSFSGLRTTASAPQLSIPSRGDEEAPSAPAGAASASAHRRGLAAAAPGSLQTHQSPRIAAPLRRPASPPTPLPPFLDDADAARLLRTSRITALTLLPGHTFTSHIFQPASLVTLRRLCDLCALYQLRVSQLSVPADVRRLMFDALPPHLSPIPASVTALTLGHSPYTAFGEVQPSWAALSTAASDWQDREPWRLPVYPSSPQSYEEGDRGRQLTLWCDDRIAGDDLPWFPTVDGCLKVPLSPGLLPDGLRLLLFNERYNQPLQLGSLPSTLTLLQLGDYFDQPIAPGVLPASLLHLCVVGSMEQHHQLLQQSLPASLERLRLCSWPHALQAGVWPAGLKALHLGRFDHPLQPHVLPASLLYLSFDCFRHPLLADVLSSSLIELDLGGWYNDPLPPRRAALLAAQADSWLDIPSTSAVGLAARGAALPTLLPIRRPISPCTTARRAAVHAARHRPRQPLYTPFPFRHHALVCALGATAEQVSRRAHRGGATGACGGEVVLS